MRFVLFSQKCLKIAVLITLLLFALSFSLAAYADTSSAKQQEFINFMLPKINQANSEVSNSRGKLLTYFTIWKNKQTLSSETKDWLQKLAVQYKVKSSDFTQIATWQNLIKRVDVLPNSLVLAQTILESAWGKSNIAHQANNYFGHFCSAKGCGIPQKLVNNNGDEITTFRDASEAVRVYLLNINTHHEYEHLRTLRQKAHSNNQNLKAVVLAEKLDKYSTLGKVYVKRIKQVIRQNNLESYDAYNQGQVLKLT